MATRRGIRISRTIGKSSGVLEKSAVGLFRWAATDHSDLGNALDRMPSMGFIDTIKYALMLFLINVIGAVIGGVWIFVLIAYGIPQLFDWLF